MSSKRNIRMNNWKDSIICEILNQIIMHVIDIIKGLNPFIWNNLRWSEDGFTMQC